MWHVSSRSGVATLQTAIHLLLTYLLTYKPHWQSRVGLTAHISQKPHQNFTTFSVITSGYGLLPNPNALAAVIKGSITMHQQHPPVVNGRCWLMQVDLNNGHKTVVDVLVSNICQLYKQNWFQFLFVVKAAALKQQTSTFYTQILSREASYYICGLS